MNPACKRKRCFTNPNYSLCQMSVTSSRFITITVTSKLRPHRRQKETWNDRARRCFTSHSQCHMQSKVEEHISGIPELDKPCQEAVVYIWANLRLLINAVQTENIICSCQLCIPYSFSLHHIRLCNVVDLPDLPLLSYKLIINIHFQLTLR